MYYKNIIQSYFSIRFHSSLHFLNPSTLHKYILCIIYFLFCEILYWFLSALKLNAKLRETAKDGNVFLICIQRILKLKVTFWDNLNISKVLSYKKKKTQTTQPVSWDGCLILSPSTMHSGQVSLSPTQGIFYQEISGVFPLYTAGTSKLQEATHVVGLE